MSFIQGASSFKEDNDIWGDMDANLMPGMSCFKEEDNTYVAEEPQFKKMYAIFYLMDNLDLPYRWIVEKKPLWRIYSRNDQSLVSTLDPDLNSPKELCPSAFMDEYNKNLFTTKEAARIEAEKRNKVS